ncbi:MAG: hypothetical protein BZ138_06470 [Methanosphaera sp. rholeuAM270]|nr:MAG: hypothetical protein BZ138_06470 [Methanosphaera sp. rholeuAM270]
MQMLETIKTKAAQFPFGRAIAMGAAAALVAASLAACGGNGGGTTAPKAGQNDTRYNVSQLEPPTSETYDGTQQTFPEGYTPAMSRDTSDSTVSEYGLEQEFEVGGTKYIVHAPSTVHASATSPGQDSFFLDVDVTPKSENAASGTNIFVYSASGLYSYDLIERAAEEEAMKAMREAEQAAGDDASKTSEIYDNYEKAVRNAVPDGSDGKPYTRTFEIPYDGDGVYALSVKDFVNDTISIVKFDIKLKS